MDELTVNGAGTSLVSPIPVALSMVAFLLVVAEPIISYLPARLISAEYNGKTEIIQDNVFVIWGSTWLPVVGR